MKPDVLLVLDDIELNQPRELALRFHAEPTQRERDGEAFHYAGAHATLRLEPLRRDGVTVDAREFPATGRLGEPGQSLYAVQLSRRAGQWRNAVAISWAPRDRNPPKVTLKTAGDLWHFQTGRYQLSFSWPTGVVTWQP